MSRKERGRLALLAGVKRKELNLVQASELLALSYRQTKRIWRRCREEGDVGLVPRLRGRPGPRRKPDAVRAAGLELYQRKDYSDFGPTLLAEHLEGQQIKVDHETVRRWLVAQEKWTAGRRGNGRQQREWNGQKLKWRALLQRPVRASRPATRSKVALPAVTSQPAREPPWRRFGMGVGRPDWRGVKRKRSDARSKPRHDHLHSKTNEADLFS